MFHSNPIPPQFVRLQITYVVSIPSADDTQHVAISGVPHKLDLPNKASNVSEKMLTEFVDGS